MRRSLLNNLDEVLDITNIQEDMNVYIHEEKKSDMTHSYSRALDLLEWDYSQRYVL